MWMLFTGMITRPIQVVRSRTQEAMKTSIPLTAAISSSFAQLCFDTLVRVALLAVLVAVFGPLPKVHLPFFILAVLTGLTFCLSLGLILSVFNMIYPDIDRLTTIILQYGIFLSGVIFPLGTMGPLAVLENYNPFNVFIKSSRDFLFFGAHAETMALLAWTGVAAVSLLLAARFFYIMEHRIREAI
jgi:lipopolysaccharide transport system permease protein